MRLNTLRITTQNWNGSRLPPPRIANKPVTYVGFKEAKAYCEHVGKRLPHDWEFQYAGQVRPTAGLSQPTITHTHNSLFPETRRHCLVFD